MPKPVAQNHWLVSLELAWEASRPPRGLPWRCLTEHEQAAFVNGVLHGLELAVAKHHENVLSERNGIPATRNPIEAPNAPHKLNR